MLQNLPNSTHDERIRLSFWRENQTNCKRKRPLHPKRSFVVDNNGLEPLTLRTSSGCSTSWANCPKRKRDYSGKGITCQEGFWDFSKVYKIFALCDHLIRLFAKGEKPPSPRGEGLPTSVDIVRPFSPLAFSALNRYNKSKGGDGRCFTFCRSLSYYTIFFCTLCFVAASTTIFGSRKWAKPIFGKTKKASLIIGSIDPSTGNTLWAFFTA